MDGGIFNNGIQMPVQLQKVNEPVNWQQVRIQAAIAAMQTVDDHVSTVEELAKRCVRYADALIAELQKKGGE
jgi:hypothetical protein